jgi:hypothetical protein
MLFVDDIEQVIFRLRLIGELQDLRFD